MTFEFRPLLTIFSALAFAALISLGVWQMQRREWKLDLIAKTEARTKNAPIPFDEAVARAKAGEDMEYTPVEAGGVYANDLEAPVFGTLDGEAGAYVFTPLDASAADGGRRFVYVNRGFVPLELLAPEARPKGEMTGEVEVRGLFRTPEHPTALERMVAPKETPDENLWFVRDPLRFAARQGIEAPPYYIDSSGAENPAAWPKGGTTRLSFYNHHLDYALTWFGLAAALVGVYVASCIKRRQPVAGAASEKV